MIVHGEYEEVETNNDDLFAYSRRYKNEILLVVCNFSNETSDFMIPDSDDFKGIPEILITNYSRQKYFKDSYLLPYEGIGLLYTR